MVPTDEAAMILAMPFVSGCISSKKFQLLETGLKYTMN
jgi:hypothetical protein